MAPSRQFRHRVDAGQQLARRLEELDLAGPMVLGIARGGIPVAAEVAKRLKAPLGVFVVSKVGMPGRDELGVGAVAEGLEEPVVAYTAYELGVGSGHLAMLVEAAQREVRRQVSLYRGGRVLPELAGREVVLVDDGLATGVTAEAALISLRLHQPSRLVLAVPVCAPATAGRLADIADDVVCVQSPDYFFAVGEWYEDFSQTTDEEVIEALACHMDDDHRSIP